MMNKFFEIAGSSIVIVCMVVFMLFCGDSSFYSGVPVDANSSIVSTSISEKSPDIDNNICCKCTDEDSYMCEY